MSARQFDIYRAQRRADEVAIVTVVWLARAFVLSRYRVGDAVRVTRAAIRPRRRA